MAITFPFHLIIALLSACGIAFLAWKAKSLHPSGAIAAVFVGFCLFGFGGWSGAIALLLFFISSSLLSRWGKQQKEMLPYEKGGERDAGQVLANGGIASLGAVLASLFPTSPLPVFVLLGALATANADTWATEIGSLAKGQPRLITTFQPAPTGSSGAVSLPGTIAAFAGALLLGGMTLFWNGTTWGWQGVLAVSLGGFFGAMADSLLGATVQAQWHCPTCHRITEQHTHCDTPTTLYRGFAWLNNDAVNIVATVVGAVSSVLLYRLFAHYLPTLSAIFVIESIFVV
jgi:uncharacterized protein (TIGR00297 family)